MSVFKKSMRKHLFIHPADRKRREAAIKSTLLQNKKKYSDKLEGALLDVDNIKIVGDRHLIVGGYLSMEVAADFHVFCPKLGQALEGVINKRSQGHLGCLVLDTFNAALSLTSSSKFDVSPQVGDSCTFVVTEVVVDGDMLFLRGTLDSVTPSQVTAESADVSQSTNPAEEMADEAQTDELTDITVDKKERKRKKKKHKEESTREKKKKMS